MDDQHDSKARYEPLESRVHGNMQARFGKGQSETGSNVPRWLSTSRKKSKTSLPQCGKNDTNGNQHDEPTYPRKTGKKGRWVCPPGATNC
jgi:hypothetical protein